jgi:hypothetical protein
MRFAVALSGDVPWRVIGESPSTWPKFGAHCIVRGRGARRFSFRLFSGEDWSRPVLDGVLVWEPLPGGPGGSGWHAAARGDEYMVITKKRLFRRPGAEGEGNAGHGDEGEVQDS